MMNLISVRNIHKIYETKPVVRAIQGIGLEVTSGDFMAIVGPSGSGKTTLLNLMGAIDRPTAGEIYFGGMDISSLSKNELAELRLRQIGFVFQTYNLISVLTVEENIEFVLRMQGLRPEEIQRRVGYLIDSLGMRAYAKFKPSDISHGEQQRVAIARAIAAEPQCVLADEPTASLDSANGTAVIDLMREINTTKGITFVIATHDNSVIERCDRIVEIKDGRINEAPSPISFGQLS
jgi:putative ABC transport system ATP-binding protein